MAKQQGSEIVLGVVSFQCYHVFIRKCYLVVPCFTLPQHNNKLTQHMLFMRFPWCDYDKEALHAFDVKKKGETSTPHYLNVITRIRLINIKVIILIVLHLL